MTTINKRKADSDAHLTEWYAKIDKRQAQKREHDEKLLRNSRNMQPLTIEDFDSCASATLKNYIKNVNKLQKERYQSGPIPFPISLVKNLPSNAVLAQRENANYLRALPLAPIDATPPEPIPVAAEAHCEDDDTQEEIMMTDDDLVYLITRMAARVESAQGMTDDASQDTSHDNSQDTTQDDAPLPVMQPFDDARALAVAVPLHQPVEGMPFGSLVQPIFEKHPDATCQVVGVVANTATNAVNTANTTTNTATNECRPTFEHLLDDHDAINVVIRHLPFLAQLRLKHACKRSREAVKASDAPWPTVSLATVSNSFEDDSYSFPVRSLPASEHCQNGSSTPSFVPAHGRICPNKSKLGLFFGFNIPEQALPKRLTELPFRARDELKRALSIMSDKGYENASERLLTDAYLSLGHSSSVGISASTLDFPKTEYTNQVQLAKFEQTVKSLAAAAPSRTTNSPPLLVPALSIFTGKAKISIEVELCYYTEHSGEAQRIRDLPVVSDPRSGNAGPGVYAMNASKRMDSFGIDDFKLVFEPRDFGDGDFARRVIYSDAFSLNFAVATKLWHIPKDYWQTRKLLCYRFKVSGEVDDGCGISSYLSYIFASNPFVHFSQRSQALTAPSGVSGSERRIERATSGFQTALTKAKAALSAHEKGLEHRIATQMDIEFAGLLRKKVEVCERRYTEHIAEPWRVLNGENAEGFSRMV